MKNKSVKISYISLSLFILATNAQASDREDITLMSGSSTIGSSTYSALIANGISSLGASFFSASGTVALMCLKFNNDTDPLTCLFKVLSENIATTADNISDYTRRNLLNPKTIVVAAQEDLMAVIAGNQKSYFAEEIIKVQRATLENEGLTNVATIPDQDIAASALRQVNKIALRIK